jgi:hypothetical protein
MAFGIFDIIQKIFLMKKYKNFYEVIKKVVTKKKPSDEKN